ncbi:origin recognition complex, subunit 6 [Pseudoneurospora amorphoporcata]|uniref:Origin recognition complex, subunit 6 n=1 Tax=Pseudoneurospora amorphoporcata TaxID=241081 RepID=A0AAN6NMX9_9PEZI|nr:origin recognition complex, subunit 6 [Pseudoneurospora amorphoporcata]
MNRSIEQALLSLLPTHNTNLPQPLVDLASSLLAQSRHRASTLKAEEEVARTYACAHLACDRLKITLNLPPIDPRPPIPPRIYKRLYSHLSNILPSTSSTPGRGTPRKSEPTTTTPRSQRTLNKTPTSRLRDQATNRHDDLTASPSAGRSTRSAGGRTAMPGTTGKGKEKEKPLHPFRGTLFPRKAGTSAGAGQGLPGWMKPTLRFLLKELGPAHIGPLVMSGIESIVAPRGQRTEDEWVNANLVSLLGALYLFVWRGVTWPGTDIDEGEYVAMRKKVAMTLKKARDQVKVAVKVGEVEEQDEVEDEEKVWEGWGHVKLKDLDLATLHIGRAGWLEMDWAAGVEDLARTVLDKVDQDASFADGQGSNKLEVFRAGQGDSMFQDRYDYLGERKQKEYAIWKQGILRKIKALENPSASSTTATPRKRKVPEANMDID